MSKNQNQKEKKEGENWEKEFGERFQAHYQYKGKSRGLGVFHDVGEFKRVKSFISQELAKAKVSSLTYREGFQAGVRTQTNLDAEDVQKARKEERKRVFKMLCNAMSGKIQIKKSDFGDLVDYLDPNKSAK